LNKKAKKTNSKIKSQINTGVLVLENKKVFKGSELDIREKLQAKFALIHR